MTNLYGWSAGMLTENARCVLFQKSAGLRATTGVSQVGSVLHLESVL